jgi:hypothetical protein
MKTIAYYWQIVRLTASGRCRAETLPQVETWLKQLLSPYPEVSDIELQTRLLKIWQGHKADADLAQLSLRCFISHQIRYVCLRLVERFGKQSNLQAAELFPLVLDDDGQLSSTYRPCALEILETYDPEKSSIATWSSRVTKTHPGITQVLSDHGVLLVSDWSLLVNAKPTQVERILGQYHLCGSAEIHQALDLLTAYHRVYKRDRLVQRSSGRTGRCQTPTPEQLREMKPDLDPNLLLSRLKHLAEQLRTYHIHVKRGNPNLYHPDKEDFEQVIHRHQDTTLDEENDQEKFLRMYRETLVACLDEAIAQVLQANRVRLQSQTPPRDKAYVWGLRLFHCQGMAMSKLAPQVGLKTQVQVNRLLNLKRLRADVRHQLIPQLHTAVLQETIAHVSPDRLQSIDQILQQLLTEEIEQMMNNAAAEAQRPKGRTTRSLFARRLCSVIEEFLHEGEEPL